MKAEQILLNMPPNIILAQEAEVYPPKFTTAEYYPETASDKYTGILEDGAIPIPAEQE